MKVILEGTDDEPFDPANDLRVLVAYLNSGLALRAHAMLERVGREAGESGRLIFSLWDFNSLSEPALVPLAVAAAKEADMIVFATPEGQPLPRQVRDWIAHWLLTKKELPRALVANLDPESAPPTAKPVVRPYLEKVASNGKMHFWARASDAQTPLDTARLKAQRAGDQVKGSKAIARQNATRAGWRSKPSGIHATATSVAQECCRRVG